MRGEEGFEQTLNLISPSKDSVARQLKLWNEGINVTEPRDSLIPFRIYRVGKAKTRPTNSGRAVMNGVTRRTRRDYARGTSIKRQREQGKRKNP